MAIEPAVSHGSSMPPNYIFVKKGHVFITGNCRKRTQASGRTVYIVHDKNKKAIGIRVPSEVHAEVCSDEVATRADRAAAVQKRDMAIEDEFRREMINIFPKVPADAVLDIIKTALKKGSGRVGRTGRIEMDEKVRFAVRAHIRHCHTDYDALLRTGAAAQRVGYQREARDAVGPKVNETARAWGERAKVCQPVPKPVQPPKPKSDPMTLALEKDLLEAKDRLARMEYSLGEYTRKNQARHPIRRRRKKINKQKGVVDCINKKLVLVRRATFLSGRLVPRRRAAAVAQRKLTHQMKEITGLAPALEEDSEWFSK